MNIPVMLNVRSLAEMLGLTPKQVLLLTRESKVTWHRQGRRRFVYLAQIKELMPEIWLSLLARNEVLSRGDP